MRAMVLLPALLIFGLTNQAESLLRFSAIVEQVHSREHQDPAGALQDVAKQAEKAGEQAAKAGEEAAKEAEKAGDEAADAVQKGPGEDLAPKKGVKRKQMDPIEVMRIEMCWGRKNLITHEDCMNWMTKHCKKETSGDGYCKKLRRYVKSKCRKGDQLGCDYAKKLGIDMATDTEQIDADDLDGDGIKDKDDAFPDNPVEWKDSDGDGVGDNSDRWPNDPTCSDEGDVCGGAPSAAPGGLAPSPAGGGLTMDEGVPLPSQGYNEFGDKYVAHDDGVTMTRDWRAEWPRSDGDEETAIKRICAKNPKHPWCKLKQSKAARKAYRLSHP